MLTTIQIQFLNRVCPNRWSEENGIVNVKGDVSISEMNLTQIPVQFGHIGGNFCCNYNKLTTLKGAPIIIDRSFECESNQLTSLEGGPKDVVGLYSCSDNKLTSIIGAPEICRNFLCDGNQLTSLEGCPRLIKNSLYCDNNPSLEYLWSIGKLQNDIDYDNKNEINEWIIECARKDIIFPHFTIEENINWIKNTRQYSCLLRAPEEIRQSFSSRILHLADSGIC